MDLVGDRRFAVDGRIVTTTGITVSMPMTLTLIEATAGRAKAQSVAQDFGLSAWDARHDTGAFAFTRPFHRQHWLSGRKYPLRWWPGR